MKNTSLINFHSNQILADVAHFRLHWYTVLSSFWCLHRFWWWK